MKLPDDSSDLERYLDELPSVYDQTVRYGCEMYQAMSKHGLYVGSKFETLEAIAREAIDEFDLNSGNEEVDIEMFNKVYADLLKQCNLS